MDNTSNNSSIISGLPALVPGGQKDGLTTVKILYLSQTGGVQLTPLIASTPALTEWAHSGANQGFYDQEHVSRLIAEADQFDLKPEKTALDEMIAFFSSRNQIKIMLIRAKPEST